MLREIIVLTFLILAGPSLLNAQQCLHDSNETPAEKERRAAALNAVRLINTAQQTHKGKLGKYASWAELAASPVFEEMRQRGQFAKTLGRISLDPTNPVLPGFTLRLTTDGEKYSLLFRDENDSCKFSFYSDQVGVIYYGQPIDMPPSAALASR